MQIKKFFETILSHIPDDIKEFAADMVTSIPGRVDSAISGAASLLPANIDLMVMLRFLLMFGGGALLISLTARVLLGRKSRLNQAVSNAIGILFIYAMTIIGYTFQQLNLNQFLSPLPFVTFAGEYMLVLPLTADTELTTICREIVSMVILAFLVNLSDSLLPKAKTMVGWFIGRFLTILLSILLHLVVRWGFDTYLPGVLVTYAPLILTVVLLAFVFLGLVSMILKLVLTVINPFMGAVYAFFFSKPIGQQLGNAVTTTIILFAVVYVMGYYGYNTINISVDSLTAYIPLALLSVLLWYGIGHLL